MIVAVTYNYVTILSQCHTYWMVELHPPRAIFTKASIFYTNTVEDRNAVCAILSYNEVTILCES